MAGEQLPLVLICGGAPDEAHEVEKLDPMPSHVIPAPTFRYPEHQEQWIGLDPDQPSQPK